VEGSFAVNYLIVKVIIIALLGYTLVLFFGVKKSVKEHKEEKNYSESIKKAIGKLSEIEKKIKGEDTMTKLDTQVTGVQNKLTLTELITRKASLSQYSEVVELVTKLIKNRYENYQFTIYPAADETSTNFLQVISNWHDDPELHKLIFAKGIEYGIEMKELQKHFAEHIRNGHVFDLGPDVVVITDDGSNSSPTNLSPINTGLEGSEVAVIVTFIEKANYKGWVEKNFDLDKVEEKLKLVVNN